MRILGIGVLAIAGFCFAEETVTDEIKKLEGLTRLRDSIKELVQIHAEYQECKADPDAAKLRAELNKAIDALAVAKKSGDKRNVNWVSEQDAIMRLNAICERIAMRLNPECEKNALNSVKDAAERYVEAKKKIKPENLPKTDDIKKADAIVAQVLK